MHKISHALMGLVCLYTFNAFSSFEGIDPKILQTAPLTFFTRPCCSFANSFFQDTLGLAGNYMGLDSLREHSFARRKKKDTVGLIYTCHGGFIDVSHLRDNADWTAQILFNLKDWLGRGQTIVARNEGSFKKRSVFFPELSESELQTLTESDLERIAIAIGYNLALLHEIPTAFNIQKGSAFSVEDAYSNMLGGYLGIEAAKNPLPFNEAMTVVTHNALSDMGALTAKGSKRVHKSVKGSWWRGSLFGGFKSVVKRDFTYEGEVVPFLVPGSCPTAVPMKLPVPSVLSNGRSVNDYFEIRAVLKPHFQKKLTKLGGRPLYFDTINQHDYPLIIQAIRSKFAKSLGKDLDTH